MGRYVDSVWPGNPCGATRAERTPCRFRADPSALLDWLELFLSCTGRACADTERFAADLTTWQTDARRRLGPVRSDSAALLVLRSLPSLPVFSITTAAAHIGRSFKATSEAVDRLAAAGVVRQVTIGRRNRAFEAVGLFEAFTGFERVLASPGADTTSSPAEPPGPPPAPAVTHVPLLSLSFDA